MRIVFLNQYYPPDAAPTGVMLESVAKKMAAEGHEVTVICAAGGYAGAGEAAAPAESVPGLTVKRIGATRFGRGSFAGKLLDYLSYYTGVAWTLVFMKPAPDRIIALTTPPYLSVLARGISKLRGADHGHWIMDLYPDVMAAHGMLGEKKLFYRGLAALARWGFRGSRCASILVLGPDMEVRVRKLLGRKVGTVDWVPLWASEAGPADGGSPADAPERNLRHERGWSEDELVVMYSGNMGLGHRFGEILDAVDRLPGCRFVFFGKGRRRGEIGGFIESHPQAKVELHDYAAAGILVPHLRSADVHLVSLDDAWTGTMVPSKLQGIFSISRPVIFIGGRESSIGRWVEESGGGWRVASGDIDGLLRALDEARNPTERATRGGAAQMFAERYFSREINVSRVVSILARPHRRDEPEGNLEFSSQAGGNAP